MGAAGTSGSRGLLPPASWHTQPAARCTSSPCHPGDIHIPTPMVPGDGEVVPPVTPHTGLVPSHASLPADVGVGTPVGGTGSSVTGRDTVTAAMPGEGGLGEGGLSGVMVVVGTTGSLVAGGTAGLVEPTVGRVLVPAGTCTQGDECHHCCSVCRMAPAPPLVPKSQGSPLLGRPQVALQSAPGCRHCQGL